MAWYLYGIGAALISISIGLGAGFVPFLAALGFSALVAGFLHAIINN